MYVNFHKYVSVAKFDQNFVQQVVWSQLTSSNLQI